MDIKFSLIDKAMEFAKKSPCHMKIGAVADIGGRQSIGVWNGNKSDPGLRRFNYPAHSAQHAEYRLCKLFKRHMAGATVYVARRSPAGQPRLAKPCAACERVLRDAGVRKVIYTIPDGCLIMRL